MAEHAPQAPVAEEGIQQTQWEIDGFLRELGNVAAGLEGLEEEHIFGPQIRQIIDTINNLKTVQDFSNYSNDELMRWIQQLRQDVPRIEREVMQFVNQISRARTVAFEVDFI
jgi:thiamine kinase-like enzyme